MEKITITYVIDWTNEQPFSQFLRTFTSIYYQIGFSMTRLKIIVITDQRRPAELNFYDQVSLFWFIFDSNKEENPFNLGITQADSTYISFITVGDLVYRSDAIRFMFDALRDNGEPDVQSAFYKSESRNRQGNILFTTDSGWYRHWGKWFRLDFLRKKDIKFHPELGGMMDTDFVTQAITRAENQTVWYSEAHPIYYKTLTSGEMLDQQPNYWKTHLDEYVAHRRLLLSALVKEDSPYLVRDLIYTIVRLYILFVDNQSSIPRDFYQLTAEYAALIKKNRSTLMEQFYTQKGERQLLEAQFLEFVGEL